MASIKETDFELLSKKFSETRYLNPDNINNLILLFIDKNESYERNYTLKHKDDFINNFNNLRTNFIKLRRFELDKKISILKKMLRILYSLYIFTTDNSKYEYCDDLYNYFLILSDCYRGIGYDGIQNNNINIVDASYYVGCYFKHQKIKNYF